MYHQYRYEILRISEVTQPGVPSDIRLVDQAIVCFGLKGMFGRITAKHEEIKKKIHAFRIPLPHWGQRVMGTLTVASTTDSLTY